MSYIKNLTKSTKFFIEDMAMEFVPIAKPIKETAQKLIAQAKSAYSGGTARSAGNIIGRMPYFNDVSAIAKNSFSGMLTGNIYSRYGMDLEEQFQTSNYNMMTDEEGEEGASAGTQSTVGDDTKLLAQATIDSAKASTDASSKIANKLHIDNRLFFTEFKSDMGKHFENTNSTLTAIASFNDGYMKQYIDNSMKYYTDSLSILQDIRRGVLPTEGNSSRTMEKEKSWAEKLNSGDIMGAGKSMLGKMVGHYDSIGMMGVLGTLASMYLPIYAQAPGQMLLDAGKWGLNKSLKLGGFVDLQEKLMKPGTMMNKLMEMMSLSENKFMRSTGEALRIKNENASRYMPKSNYDGNVVAKWDLESKTALTVVIPQYLATMTSALTGLEEKFYDAGKNDWYTREEMTKEFRKEEPNSTNIENSIARVLGKKFDKKSFGFEGKDDEFNVIVNMVAKALVKDSRSLDSLTTMSLNKTESGAKGLRELLGVAGDPTAEKYIDDKLLTGLADAVYKINMDKDDRDTNAKIYDSILEYGKNFRPFYENASNNRIGSGIVFGMNNGLYGSKFKGANGKFSDRSNDSIASFFAEDDANANLNKLKELHGAGAFVNDAARDQAKLPSLNGLIDVDWSSLTGRRRKDAMKHFMQMKMGSEAANNQAAEDHDFVRNNSTLGELKGPHVFDAKAAIAGNDYNPIVEKMAKKIADDVEEATKGEMSDDEKSGLKEVLSERSETIKKELKAIDDNKSLTDAEKAVQKDKVMKKGASILTEGISSLFKGSKFFSDANANGQVKSVAKIVGMGMAGVMGANLFGGLMGSLPGLGTIMGAAGWLTPVLLSGLGLGAGVYAAKTGLLSNIFGSLKDPGKRKDLMNKLVKSTMPDLFLGGVTGVGSSMILSHLLPFGSVMGPIMGASLGLATGIYSHQSGLMSRLFGTDDNRKNKKDHAGQMGRNRWFNFFKTMTAGAVGLGGAAALLKGMGGLPAIGGVLGMGGSIISNPIIFAASAVASGILLEKDNIKKKIFGDGSEKHSFTKNLGMWLFGDKKTNKEGILSRQFKKFGSFVEKGSTNISKWFKESIIGNAKLAFKPMTEGLGKIGKSVVTAFMGGWDKLSDKMKESMDKGFIKSLATAFEEKVINPISAKIGGFFNFFFKTVGSVAAAPFKFMAKLFTGETFDEHQEREKSEKQSTVKESLREKLENRAEGLRRTGSKLRNKIFGKGGSANDMSNIYGMGIKAKYKNMLNNRDAKYGAMAKARGAVHDPSTGISKEDTFISQTGKLGLVPLGDSNMKESGCAVACMGMVIAKLKKDKDISPAELAKEATAYKVAGDGIRPEYFGAMAKTFRLSFMRVKKDNVHDESMIKAIKRGYRIIALMEKSYNGIGRHYIYLKGVKNNSIIFDDPMTGPDKTMNYWLLNKSAIEYFIFADGKQRGGIRVDTILPMNADGTSPSAPGVNEADNDKKDKEPESIGELVQSKVGGVIEDHLGKAMDMIGLGFMKDSIVNVSKLAMKSIKERITNKGDAKSAEAVVEEAKAQTATPTENTKPATADTEYEDNNSYIVDKDMKGPLKELNKLYKKNSSKTNKYLAKINKTLEKQTNGVAYNIEYIKRLLVKHIGDLENENKPEKQGFFNFKMKGFRSGIGGWFLDKMDSVGGFIKGLFNLKDSPVLKGMKWLVEKSTTGLLKVADKLTFGLSGFFTKTLPTLIDGVLVQPIKGIFKTFGENVSKFTGLIADTMNDFRKAAGKVIGDMYAAATTSLAALAKIGGASILGIGKMLFSGIAESGIGKKIFGGIGSLVGGALKGVGNMFGITKIFSGLGSKMSSLLGPKKVVVQGGWIDLVKKVEGVGAVGTVDQDTYGRVASATNTAASVRDSVNSADKPTGRDPVSRVTNATRASEPSNTNLRASDKEQDAKDALQTAAFQTIVEKLGGKVGGKPGKPGTGNSNRKPGDADGDGIPDSQENKSDKSGFWSTMGGMLAGSAVGKIFGKIFAKSGAKGLFSKLAGTRLGSFIGSKMAGRTAGGLIKGAGKGLAKYGALGLMGLTAGGWALDKAGKGMSALGFDGAGQSMSNLGEKVATPGRVALETAVNPVADFFGVSMPTTDAFTDQIAKRTIWGTAKNRFLKDGFKNVLERNLIKASHGGLDAAQDMLKSDAVKKYLISRGVDLKKFGINAGITATAEKTAKLMAETESASLLKKLFNAKAVKKYVMKQMGKDMSEAAAEQLIKELTKAATRNAGKKAGLAALKSALIYIPYVNIISIITFFLIDFGWGWFKAKDYMKVEKPNKLMKFVAGMTNALQGTISSLSPFLLFIALIPTEIITQIIWKWGLKIFGTDEDVLAYNKEREKYLAKEAKKQKSEENRQRSNAKLYDKIADDKDEKAINAFSFKHGTYSIVGDEITGHDQKIIRNRMVNKFMGDSKTSTGMDATTFKEVMDKQNKQNNKFAFDTKSWYNISKIWDPFKIDTKILSDATRFRETLRDNANLDFTNLSNSMSNYDIAGYSYAEVGCGPEALFNVYTSYGLKPERKYLARVASYYKKYIQSGQGIPWKYIVDYAVFDGFCCKVLRPEPKEVVAAVAGFGYKVILLLQNVDGTAHYVAVTNATTKQNLVIIDPLRRGAIDSEGKASGKIGAGQSYVKPDDAKFWNNVIGAVAIAPKAEGKLGYDNVWYQLYPDAKDKISKNPMGFKFAEIGNFMDAGMMFEARAWADARFNPDVKKGKPNNFEYFREQARSTLKQYNFEGRYTEDQIKGMILRDVYDNGANGGLGDTKYIVYTNNKGKMDIGMTHTSREGNNTIAMNSFNAGGGRKIDLFDPMSKSYKYVTINEDDPYIKTDTTFKPKVTTLFPNDSTNAYTYMPNMLRDEISRLAKTKQNFVLDDQGGYGSKRPNFVTSSMRNNVNALNDSLDRYRSMQQQAVVNTNTTTVKEVVKMGDVENLLGSLNSKFDTMIAIMTALVANGSGGVNKETLAAILATLAPKSNNDNNSGFMSEMLNMSQ